VTGERIFREGRASDLRATFDLGGRALRAAVSGSAPALAGAPPDKAFLDDAWGPQKPLLEFISAQPGSGFWVCEEDGELVGFVRLARFAGMDELTDMAVAPDHAGSGIGKALLERVWPGRPTRERGRVVVTLGTPADLTLYTRYGVMPATGHWHLRCPADRYQEARSLLATDKAEPAVHVLTPERAVEEWKRLEPLAIGHERPALHEFFGRTRSCLACVDEDSGGAQALCWVSPEADIGPAVGATPEALVPVVLAALDRVAKAHEPELLGVYCTTDAWWLLDRLRRTGFHLYWPSWVMSSVPLPGLDRYLPTRPPRLL
jgi:GNAT superfamily N-acetyltransferase